VTTHVPQRHRAHSLIAQSSNASRSVEQRKGFLGGWADRLEGLR